MRDGPSLWSRCRALIQQRGRCTTRELADALDRGSAEVSSVLHGQRRRGHVIRIDGQPVMWRLPSGQETTP